MQPPPPPPAVLVQWQFVPVLHWLFIFFRSRNVLATQARSRHMYHVFYVHSSTIKTYTCCLLLSSRSPPPHAFPTPTPTPPPVTYHHVKHPTLSYQLIIGCIIHIRIVSDSFVLARISRKLDRSACCAWQGEKGVSLGDVFVVVGD